MRLSIRTLSGHIYNIETELSVTVGNLKKKLHKMIQIIPERQKLIYCGNLLENDKILDEYHIQNLTTLHIIFIDEKEYWKTIMKKKRTTFYI
jgi:hypothetical protein